MSDHNQIDSETSQNQQDSVYEKSIRVKRLNLMLMLMVFLMLVLPGLWIYLHIPGGVLLTSDPDEGYTTQGMFVIGGVITFSAAFFWFIKWRLDRLETIEDDSPEKFDTPQPGAEVPNGVSNARIGYLITFSLTVLSLLSLLTVGVINGNGPVREDLLPLLYFGLVGLFVGISFLYFGVRCGHCGTGLFSLMRRDTTTIREISYSGDHKEIFNFAINSRCPKCGIRRR